MTSTLRKALAEYDAEVAKCPLNSPSLKVRQISEKECRLCGSTARERCGQNNPYALIQAVREVFKDASA